MANDTSRVVEVDATNASDDLVAQLNTLEGADRKGDKLFIFPHSKYDTLRILAAGRPGEMIVESKESIESTLEEVDDLTPGELSGFYVHSIPSVEDLFGDEVFDADEAESHGDDLEVEELPADEETDQADEAEANSVNVEADSRSEDPASDEGETGDQIDGGDESPQSEDSIDTSVESVEVSETSQLGEEASTEYVRPPIVRPVIVMGVDEPQSAEAIARALIPSVDEIEDILDTTINIETDSQVVQLMKVQSESTLTMVMTLLTDDVASLNSHDIEEMRSTTVQLINDGEIESLTDYYSAVDAKTDLFAEIENDWFEINREYDDIFGAWLGEQVKVLTERYQSQNPVPDENDHAALYARRASETTTIDEAIARSLSSARREVLKSVPNAKHLRTLDKFANMKSDIETSVGKMIIAEKLREEQNLAALRESERRTIDALSGTLSEYAYTSAPFAPVTEDSLARVPSQAGPEDAAADIAALLDESAASATEDVVDEEFDEFDEFFGADTSDLPDASDDDYEEDDLSDVAGTKRIRTGSTADEWDSSSEVVGADDSKKKRRPSFLSTTRSKVITGASALAAVALAGAIVFVALGSDSGDGGEPSPTETSQSPGDDETGATQEEAIAVLQSMFAVGDRLEVVVDDEVYPVTVQSFDETGAVSTDSNGDQWKIPNQMLFDWVQSHPDQFDAEALEKLNSMEID